MKSDVQVFLFICYEVFVTILSFLPLSTFSPDADRHLLKTILWRTELFIGLQIVAVIIRQIVKVPVFDFLPNLTKVFSLWIVATFLFHAISWCYGASAFESFGTTLHFSSLMASLTVLPYSMFFHATLTEAKKIFLLNRTDTEIEDALWFSIWGTMLGAWLGAFPIPLDWDRPWQVWPVSCIIGAVLGHVCGLLIFGISLLIKTKTGKSKFKFL